MMSEGFDFYVWTQAQAESARLQAEIMRQLPPQGLMGMVQTPAPEWPEWPQDATSLMRCPLWSWNLKPFYNIL